MRSIETRSCCTALVSPQNNIWTLANRVKLEKASSVDACKATRETMHPRFSSSHTTLLIGPSFSPQNRRASSAASSIAELLIFAGSVGKSNFGNCTCGIFTYCWIIATMFLATRTELVRSLAAAVAEAMHL